MCIFKFRRHPCHCLFFATSKANVIFNMSNKQSLSSEKCIRFMFHYFKDCHLFKPSTVLGLGYSALTGLRRLYKGLVV